MTSESGPPVSIDDLDRRIIGALQIDGRASWLRIARVLGENERTVARRGSRLLESGMVRVAGIQLKEAGTILALRCGPGQVRMCSRAISGRPETMWAHVVAGSRDIVTEVQYPKAREQAFLLDEVPALPGLRTSEAYPVLRYLRTAHQWRSGVLSATQRAELEAGMTLDQKLEVGGLEGLSRADRVMHAALLDNGRCTFEQLARLAGVSEATASRRVEQMRQSGQLVVRAVVDPAVLGLKVKALVWVRATPAKLAALSTAVESSDQIRYASRITGPYQVLVAVDLASRNDLDAFLSSAEWVEYAESVDVAIVVTTVKRGGLLSEALQ